MKEYDFNSKIGFLNFTNVTLFINNVLYIDTEKAVNLFNKLTGQNIKHTGFSPLISRGLIPRPDIQIKHRNFFNSEKLEYFIIKNFVENEKYNKKVFGMKKAREKKEQEKIENNEEYQKIIELREKRQAVKDERLKRREKRKEYINHNLPPENPFKQTEKQSNNDNISDEIDTSNIINPFFIRKKGLNYK